MRRLQDIMTENLTETLSYKTHLLSMTKTFSVLRMRDGEVFVETEDLDEDGITTREILKSSDGTVFTIIGRERFGDLHHGLRSYYRDTYFPLYSKVTLNA